MASPFDRPRGSKKNFNLNLPPAHSVKMASLDEMKTLVAGTLEAKGVLAKIKVKACA